MDTTGKYAEALKCCVIVNEHHVNNPVYDK